MKKTNGEQPMYPLLPWRFLATAITMVVAVSLYVDDLGSLVGLSITDRSLIRYLPPVLIAFLVGFFGSTARWSPWRVIWRLFPVLNRWAFPDLNGVWLGSTGSNWPTLKKMFEAAQAHRAIEQIELHSTPEQRDAMAVEITATLFSLRITAGLSATDGTSYSITARPRRHQQTGQIHLTYVYEQQTPDPEITDEERHMRAADLAVDPDNWDAMEGIYWTRRNWKTGLNTAGRLELRRVAGSRENGKSLRKYAADEKGREAGRV